MKVLHVETGMHLYGGALQVVFLVRGLARRGCDNVLVCPRGSAIGEALRGVAEVVELPFRGDLDLAFVPRLRRLVRAHVPDIIHLHSRRGADVLGGLAAVGTGVPVVLSRRVDNPEARWAVRLKYRLYDTVVTISEGIRRVLLAEGLDPGKVVCVHSAVDTEVYRPDADRARLRQAFGLADDVLAVGMIAQMIERKGHRDLLDALPAVVERYPELRVILFGQGPLASSLEAAVAERDLSGYVRFAGFRADLPDLLPALDLVVHPARMEGLGVALLQASACAVPIVAARAGGIPEAVEDGVNGLLFPPGDSAALAQAMSQLCGDPVLRQTMGRRGRERVLQRFSIDAMVEGNCRVYRALSGS